MAEAIIDIADAWKIYRVGDLEIPAVQGVSLAIPAAQFVAITGASGSGKSTFMHLIGCLDRLTRGSYRFEGRTVHQLSARERAALRNQRIGFVFQSFNLIPRTTVLDNVALPLAYRGIGLLERRGRAAHLLERVGLADRMQHHPNQLSGGQQQRVAIARALVTGPAIILADEPTGNLDSATSTAIMEMFSALNRDERLTIILVTHEDEIAAYAQRHIVFRDGEIMSDEQRGRVGAA